MERFVVAEVLLMAVWAHHLLMGVLGLEALELNLVVVVLVLLWEHMDRSMLFHRLCYTNIYHHFHRRLLTTILCLAVGV